MKSQKVSKFIAVSLLSLLLALFFFSIYFYNINTEIKNSNAWIIHNNKVLYKSEKLMSLLKDLETSTRGFVITGDSIFLRSYFSAKDNIPNNISELKDLTKDNPFQQSKIAALSVLADKRIAICKKAQALRAYGNYSASFITPVLNDGKKVMNEIKDTLNSVQQEENRQLTIKEETNKENENKSQQGFYILFISLLLLVLTVFFANAFLSVLRKKESNALFQLDEGLLFFSKCIDEIVKGISDSFFALDKNYCFVFYNSAVQKGIGQGKGSFNGKNIFDIFPQYKENIIGNKIREVMQTKQSIAFEAYEDFLDQWQDITIYPTAEGLSVYIKDATKRKQYEKELHTMQQLLESTNQVALVGGWEYEVFSGRVTWTSVTRLIHETGDDFVPDLKTGLNFYKEGRTRELITALVTEAMEYGKGWDEELQIITAKGNEKWIRIKGKAEFDDGECVRLIGTFQDIDAQKKMNDQLLKSEQQFRSAFNNSLDGMVLVDPNLHSLEANPAFFTMIGYTKEEFIELGFTAVTHPDDRVAESELYYKILEGKIKNWQYEKRYLHKTGEIIWVEAYGSAITDNDGNIVSLIAQMHDITKKKKADEKAAEEQNLLKTIIDNLPMNIYVKDLQSRRILINNSELLYSGAKSEDEILGKTDWDLYSYQTASNSIAEDNYVFTTGNPVLNKETKFVDHNGTETWFVTSKIPYLDKKKEIIGLLGINIDISSAKNRAAYKLHPDS